MMIFINEDCENMETRYIVVTLEMKIATDLGVCDKPKTCGSILHLIIISIMKPNLHIKCVTLNVNIYMTFVYRSDL